MNTVAGLSIEYPGSGYVTGTSKAFLNLEHGNKFQRNGTPLAFQPANLFVDITVDSNGAVITAIPTPGKTGLDFSVDDLVFLENPRAKNLANDLCILRITSTEP